MLTYELFFYARTGMMSGMGRAAFDGKARMQWVVDLVCKAIFNPPFMQVVSTAINRQPGRSVSLHKPLASSDESSYLFHSTCSVNLHITMAHASRPAPPIIVVTGANKYVDSLDHTVSRALHSPTSL